METLEVAWVGQVDGDSDMAPISWLWVMGGEWLRKETMASTSTSLCLTAAPPVLALMPDNSVPACFHSQKLWGILFLALGPWAGVPGVGLGLLTAQRGPPQLRYPSQLLSATRGCGDSLFCISDPATSLDVVSFLHPSFRASA